MSASSRLRDCPGNLQPLIDYQMILEFDALSDGDTVNVHADGNCASRRAQK
jgi:hypothetical protein